jgi:hypothetical protein
MPRRPQSSVSAEVSPPRWKLRKTPSLRPVGGRLRDCAAKRILAGVPKAFSACLSVVKAITNRVSKYHVDWWVHQPQIRCGP